MTDRETTILALGAVALLAATVNGVLIALAVTVLAVLYRSAVRPAAARAAISATGGD